MRAELIPVIFPVLFIPFWFFIIWVVGRLGGWSKLVPHYAREVYGEVDWKRWRSVYINSTRYKGGVNFGISRDYLYMQPMLLFRVGHPTLGIPWRDITIAEERVFFITRYLLTFAKCPDVRLRVYGSFVKSFPNYTKSLVP